MEVIYGPQLVIGNENAKEQLFDFLKSNYSWHLTEKDGNDDYFLYLTENIYIKLRADNAFRIFIKDIDNWNSELTYTYALNTTAANIKFAMYKVNDDCFGLSVAQDGYSWACIMVIDTYTLDDNKYKMIVCHTADYQYTYVADGFTTYNQVYTPYKTGTNTSSSLNAYIRNAQIAPFVSPYGGETADNLYNILMTNTSNRFVTLNDKLWFFTNGFALPCGNKITYT